MANKRNTSTIAAIMLGNGPRIAIDMLADEILQSNIAKNASARAVSWDCDDLVFLDFDNLRIALYEIEATRDNPPFICLGVGTGPGSVAQTRHDCPEITEELVQKLTRIMPANAVLWHDDTRNLGPDVMDDFHDALSNMLDHLNCEIQNAQTAYNAAEDTPSTIHCEDLSRGETLQNDVLLNKLRGYLHDNGQHGETIKPRVHLSLYMFVATLFLTIPALGSALLSYIWLRSGLDKSSSSS